MKNKVINLFGNDMIVQNKGEKYSELLEKFMIPFQNSILDFEFPEDFLEFALLAWNFGNMKALMPKEEFTKIMSTTPDKKVDSSLLKKMIDFKYKNFKEYTNFIVDFEFKITDDDTILVVTTQEKDAYFSNVFNDKDDQMEFKENYINRSAIIIKPLQPFLDWVNNLYSDENNENNEENEVCEVNIYLVNEEITDLEMYLQKKFDKFFMMELEARNTNKKKWPQKRNYKMFKQWFQIQTSYMIYDLEKNPIFKID
jgi:hypothetical protein